MTTKSVLLMVPDNFEFCLGAATYAHGLNWRLTLKQAEQETLDQLRENPADGILAAVRSRDIAEQLAELSCPVVNSSGVLEHSPISRVLPDDVAAGHVAAKHFLTRNFAHLAYASFANSHYSKNRFKGFRKEIESDNGRHLFVYSAPREGSLFGVDKAAEQARKTLRDFLKSLPRPCGLFCENDYLALQAVQLCHEVELRVPEDIAVLGMDNRRLECLLSYPPLSSVVSPRREIGYAAAKLLDQQMRTGKWKTREIIIPVLHVEERQSTDVLAVEDSSVVKALREIRTRALGALSVDEVATAAGVSRRSLEQKFKKYFQRSPLQEITRLRLERAKTLLRQTSLPLTEVAEQSGFPSVQWLHTVFARAEGMTPGRYRRKHSLHLIPAS